MTYRDPVWLREQYVERGLTLRAVARLGDTDEANIRYWLRKHGIPVRRPGLYARRKGDRRKKCVPRILQLNPNRRGDFDSSAAVQRLMELWGAA